MSLRSISSLTAFVLLFELVVQTESFQLSTCTKSITSTLQRKNVPIQFMYPRKGGDEGFSRVDLMNTESTTTATSRRNLLTTTILGMSTSILGSTILLRNPSTAEAAATLGEEYRQGTAALSDMDTAAPVPRDAYKKLSSGVVYADLRPGTGTELTKPGSRVNIQWVLRKSNGYFVDSSEKNESVPFIFTIGDGTAIKGLDEGMLNMKVGAVRRILMPPSLAYVDGLEDGKPGPLPSGFGPRQQMRRVQTVRKDVPGEYVFLEVQLTRMR